MKIKYLIRFWLLSVLFYFNMQVLSAQENKFTDMAKLRTITTNAPTTSGLGRFGEYPVNKVYGLPDISIPLLEYASGDIMEKVNLSYHAGGIKVRDRASWVGLGWSLFAGGVITTNVNGAPDLEGYFKNAKIVPTIQSRISTLLRTTDKLDSISTGMKICSDILSGDAYHLKIDYMPDVYNINSPSISGSFVYNKDWNPELTDATLPIKVVSFNKDVTTIYSPPNVTPFSVTTREAIHGFNVVDQNGDTYTFGSTDDLIDCNCKEYTAIWPETETYNKYGYTSAYYLTKIVSADLKDTVEFIYEKDALITDNQTNSFIFNSPNYGGFPCSLTPSFKSVLNTETNTVKLKEIKFKNGKIEFLRSSWQNGEDSKLDSIVQYQKNDAYISEGYTAIKHINFHYDFFINKDNTKNLKLSEITINGKDNAVVQHYSFNYNPLQLPGKYSNDLDHWGYYNGANNPGTSDYGLMEYNKLGLIPPSALDGINQGGVGNRESNENFTQACVLNKVYYPTGGYSEFKYENHMVGTKKFGGLRIKQISNYNYASALQASSIKSYDYSNGYLLGFDPTAGTPYFRSYYQDCENCDFESGAPQEHKLVYAFYANALGVHQGSSTTAYEQIIEKQVDQLSYSLGSTIYKYNKLPDLANYYKHLVGPYQSTATEREKVLFVGLYNEKNDPIKETEYFYHSNLFFKNIALGFSVTRDNFYSEEIYLELIHGCALKHQDFNPNYTFLTYPVSQFKTQLYKTVEKNYNSTGSGVLSNTTEYFYKSTGEHPFPVRIVENNSKGDSQSIIKMYPLDYYIPSSGAPIYNQLNELREKHVLTAVINESKLVNNEITNSFVTEYNGLYPKTVYSYEPENKIDWPYDDNSTPTEIIPIVLKNYTKPKIGFTFSNKKLVSQQKESGTSISYIWGYDNTFPIAKVENATTYDIGFKNYEWKDNGVIENYVVDVDAHTGKNCAKLAINQATGQFNKYNLSHGKYVYSAWVKSSGAGYIQIQDVYNSTNKITKVLPNSQGKWEYIEVEITIGIGSANLVASIVNDGSSIIYVDDVSFYPRDAQITTYTYEPLVGMSTITDPKGYTIYYNYDAYGRLIAVKDAQGNILSENEYHYKN